MSLLIIEGVLFRPLENLVEYEDTLDVQSQTSKSDKKFADTPSNHLESCDKIIQNDFAQKDFRSLKVSSFLMPSLHSLASIESQSYYSIKSPLKDKIQETPTAKASHENFYSICNTDRTEDFYSCDEKEFEIKSSNPAIVVTNTKENRIFSSSLKSNPESFAREVKEEKLSPVVS